MSSYGSNSSGGIGRNGPPQYQNSYMGGAQNAGGGLGTSYPIQPTGPGHYANKYTFDDAQRIAQGGPNMGTGEQVWMTGPNASQLAARNMWQDKVSAYQASRDAMPQRYDGAFGVGTPNIGAPIAGRAQPPGMPPGVTHGDPYNMGQGGAGFAPGEGNPNGGFTPGLPPGMGGGVIGRNPSAPRTPAGNMPPLTGLPPGMHGDPRLMGLLGRRGY